MPNIDLTSTVQPVYTRSEHEDSNGYNSRSYNLYSYKLHLHIIVHSAYWLRVGAIYEYTIWSSTEPVVISGILPLM